MFKLFATTRTIKLIILVRKGIHDSCQSLPLRACRATTGLRCPIFVFRAEGTSSYSSKLRATQRVIFKSTDNFFKVYTRTFCTFCENTLESLLLGENFWGSHFAINSSCQGGATSGLTTIMRFVVTKDLSTGCSQCKTPPYTFQMLKILKRVICFLPGCTVNNNNNNSNRKIRLSLSRSCIWTSLCCESVRNTRISTWMNPVSCTCKRQLLCFPALFPCSGHTQKRFWRRSNFLRFWIVHELDATFGRTWCGELPIRPRQCHSLCSLH